MIEARHFRARLLAWFDEHARDLPWRRAPSPYATLVSEVMLQQTRVETVIPYYERWLARFPSVAVLADSPEDDVLRAWEGLGYYSRARNLHRAARVVRERFAGELPSDYGSLRELPGIGDYTAGAVSSIAFGDVQPAVDGNVRRVLARVLDLESPRPTELRGHAAMLVDPRRPGDFNQALMELGATVCTPRSPRCDQCPVEALCRARARGTVALRPARRKRAAIPTFELLTVAVFDGFGRVLLRRRPAKGLLAGMWEFPSCALDPAADPEDQARALAAQLGADGADLIATLPAVEHAFSHRRETYHPYLLEIGAAGAHQPPCAWVEPESLRAQPMPRAQRRIQKLVLQVRQRPVDCTPRHSTMTRRDTMPDRPTRENPDQETRNDDPNVQDQREQRARGEKDQAEGERTRTGGTERVNPATEDERVNPEVSPRGDRKHNAREARRPGGGRKGMSA